LLQGWDSNPPSPVHVTGEVCQSIISNFLFVLYTTPIKHLTNH